METDKEKLTLKEVTMEDFKKKYFRNIDDTFCQSLEDIFADARYDELEEIIVLEAIPDNDSSGYIWCTHQGEVTEKSDCRKSICPWYSSKSGRGKCESKGQLYMHGEQIKFKVPENE